MLLKSENKYEDMVDIMESLHNYVPTLSLTETVQLAGTEDEEVEVDLAEFHYTLMGGDQLTAARARGSKRVRSNSENPKERLEGLLPVCEDWHAKQCLLGVSNIIIVIAECLDFDSVK